jgi:hypothetical protein
MNIHTNPAELARAIGKASKRVSAISYGYPECWQIETKTRPYVLGTDNGTVGWCDGINGELWEELEGSDENTAPEVIALAFSAWLDKVEAN